MESIFCQCGNKSIYFCINPECNNKYLCFFECKDIHSKEFPCHDIIPINDFLSKDFMKSIMYPFERIYEDIEKSEKEILGSLFSHLDEIENTFVRCIGMAREKISELGLNNWKDYSSKKRNIIERFYNILEFSKLFNYSNIEVTPTDVCKYLSENKENLHQFLSQTRNLSKDKMKFFENIKIQNNLLMELFETQSRIFVNEFESFFNSIANFNFEKENGYTEINKNLIFKKDEDTKQSFDEIELWFQNLKVNQIFGKVNKKSVSTDSFDLDLKRNNIIHSYRSGDEYLTVSVASLKNFKEVYNLKACKINHEDLVFILKYAEPIDKIFVTKKNLGAIYCFGFSYGRFSPSPSKIIVQNDLNCIYIFPSFQYILFGFPKNINIHHFSSIIEKEIEINVQCEAIKSFKKSFLFAISKFFITKINVNNIYKSKSIPLKIIDACQFDILENNEIMIIGNYLCKGQVGIFNILIHEETFLKEIKVINLDLFPLLSLNFVSNKYFIVLSANQSYSKLFLINLDDSKIERSSAYFINHIKFLRIFSESKIILANYKDSGLALIQ